MVRLLVFLSILLPSIVFAQPINPLPYSEEDGASFQSPVWGTNYGNGIDRSYDSATGEETVTVDIGELNSGTLSTSRGGTGATSYTNNRCVRINNSGIFESAGVDCGGAITSAFALYADPAGTDSATCGPVNTPCKTITGANGIHAKIAANNDNGFYTCSTDLTKGCGRCSNNSATQCNENSDCTSGGVCSNLYCSDDSTKSCTGTCTGGGNEHCLFDGDCPFNQTCQLSGTCSGGTQNGQPCTMSLGGSPNACELGAGSCLTTSVDTCTGGSTACSSQVSVSSSICPSTPASCSGGGKVYAIYLGPGGFYECIRGSNQTPSPGWVTYNGQGRNITSIVCGDSGAGVIAFDTTNRVAVDIERLGITTVLFAQPDALWGSYGNSHACNFKEGGAFPGIGGTLIANIMHKNRGNITNGIEDVWTGGSTPHFYFEPHPNKVCTGNQTMACENTGQCTGAGTGVCTGRICSNDASLACDADGDCSGGGKCIAINGRSTYRSNDISSPSADWGIFGGFFQTGGDDGPIIDINAISCGTDFNLILTGQIDLQGADSGSTAFTQGLRTRQTSCHTSTPTGLKHKTLLQVRDGKVTLGSGGGLTSVDEDLFVGEGTTVVPTSFIYNASKRDLQTAVTGGWPDGKLQYTDSSANSHWGGGPTWLGNIESDQPRKAPIEKLTAPTCFTCVSTTGGGIDHPTTFYYKVTALNQYGETELSLVGGPWSTTSGTTNKFQMIWFTAGSAATNGYKVYRSTTSNGTFQLVCGITGTNACPDITPDVGLSLIAFEDICGTGDCTPGATGPTTNSTAKNNPQNGEAWYSTTQNRLLGWANGVLQYLGFRYDSFTTKAKTADECVDSNASTCAQGTGVTLQDDNDLVFTGLSANTTYTVSGRLQVQADGTASDIKLAFTCPTGGSAKLWTVMFTEAGTTITDQQSQHTVEQITNCTTPTATSVFELSAGGTDYFINIDGTITLGSTAGDVKLQWAQNSAQSADTRVMAGSWITLTKAN